MKTSLLDLIFEIAESAIYLLKLKRANKPMQISISESAATERAMRLIAYAGAKANAYDSTLAATEDSPVLHDFWLQWCAEAHSQLGQWIEGASFALDKSVLTLTLETPKSIAPIIKTTLLESCACYIGAQWLELTAHALAQSYAEKSCNALKCIADAINSCDRYKGPIAWRRRLSPL